MENPVKASPRAIMSHHAPNPVGESESSISSRDEQEEEEEEEENSFQEMPLKLVKREIDNSTTDEDDDCDFDDDLEGEDDKGLVQRQQQRINLVNHLVICQPSSPIQSRQVNEPF